MSKIKNLLNKLKTTVYFNYYLLEQDDEEEINPNIEKFMRNTNIDPNTVGNEQSPQGENKGFDPNTMDNEELEMGEEDSNSMMFTEPTKTPEDIGRIYELKKIYYRLIAIQNYLAGSADPFLLKLRTYIADSIDMFDTIINNIEVYKKNIDDIIIMYYKLIKMIYAVIGQYFKKKKLQDMKNGKDRQIIEKNAKKLNTTKDNIKLIKGEEK